MTRSHNIGQPHDDQPANRPTGENLTPATHREDQPRASPAQHSLGRVGFDAYGNAEGPHGAWKTFDGRPIPQWESLEKGQNDDGSQNAGGPLTLERWERAADAIIAEYLRRNGKSAE